MKEQDIQNQIIEYLHLRRIKAYRINSGMIRTDKGYMVKLAPRGFSDIVGVLEGGRALFIEVKMGKNKPTALQKMFLEEMREQGALAFVAWGIEDVERELSKL